MNTWLPKLARGGEPKYRSIADSYAQAIRNGQLPPGEKLPPHRVLARQLGVTTGTVSRAYAELEQRGLAIARVGDGTYVAEYVAEFDRYAAAADAVRSARTATGTPPGDIGQGAASATPLPQAASRLIDLGQNVPVPTQAARVLTATLRELALDERLAGELLLYQPEAGRRSHREAGAHWLATMGCAASAERVLVTQGAQHALACVLRAVLRPGDTIVAEALSYPGILALARQLRLNLVGIEIDEEGLVPEALERACTVLAPRAVFCVPTLHNPTTVTMSDARRRAIADIALRYNVVVIEDLVPAAILATPPRPIAALLPEHGIAISGFSKAVAPGLRIGYVHAPQEWVGKIVAVIRSDCWMTAPLAAEIVTRWIDSGEIARLISLQRERIDALHALAAEALDGVPYRTDAASAHLWLPLAEPWRAAEFAAALRQAGVLVKTADSFAIGRGAVPHAVRVSMSGARSAEALRDGLQMIARTLRNGPEGLYSA
ncbi:transcriptional regulator MdrR2 [Paraburkholderia jirisanensis]